ncbi:MAG: HU family DNA-binding protein [Bacteroidales bacterium]|nr:HU family DNA-binding protein [Bacteroidales bacterium]
MNTKEFIQALAEKLGITQKEASGLLEHTTTAIREAVAADQKVTITHLGSFQLKKTASRAAYLPALDKKAIVPPKNSVQYHAAESLKDNLKKSPEK